MALDVRPILPAIGVPAIVIHRTGDPLEAVEAGRQYAAGIRVRRSWSYLGKTTTRGREIKTPS